MTQSKNDRNKLKYSDIIETAAISTTTTLTKKEKKEREKKEKKEKREKKIKSIPKKIQYEGRDSRKSQSAPEIKLVGKRDKKDNEWGLYNNHKVATAFSVLEVEEDYEEVSLNTTIEQPSHEQREYKDNEVLESQSNEKEEEEEEELHQQQLDGNSFSIFEVEEEYDQEISLNNYLEQSLSQQQKEDEDDKELQLQEESLHDVIVDSVQINQIEKEDEDFERELKEVGGYYSVNQQPILDNPIQQQQQLERDDDDVEEQERDLFNNQQLPVLENPTQVESTSNINNNVNDNSPSSPPSSSRLSKIRSFLSSNKEVVVAGVIAVAGIGFMVYKFKK